MQGEPPPAGWYPDPLEGSGYRRWDGSSWTLDVRSEATLPLGSEPGSADPNSTAIPPAYAPSPIAPEYPVSTPGAIPPAYPTAPWSYTPPAPVSRWDRSAYGRNPQTNVIVVVMLFMCFPIGLIAMWVGSTWSLKTKTIVTVSVVSIYILLQLSRSLG